MILLSPQFRSRFEQCGLAAYDDFVALADIGEPVARSRSGATWRMTIGGGADAIRAFLKRYDYTHRGRWRWERDKGAVEARNYELMRDRCGLNVPIVMARGERCRGLRRVEGFLLTAAIDEAISLDALADSRGGVSRPILHRTAESIRRMHDNGFYHIDLQWRNILVAESRAGVEIWFLDSSRGGMRLWSVSRAYGRIRDLSSLHKEARRWLSARDELRWLKTYLGRPLAAMDRAMVRTILRDRAIKENAPAA